MRVLAAMRIDVRLQARNQLYAISIVVAALTSAALAWLSPPERLAGTIPLGVLALVGGSTLLYVIAMVILERADGTLAALTVTPLRPWEYLMAKTATLTGIATLEAVVLIGGTLAILALDGPVALPNLGLIALGIAGLGILHVLTGVVLVAPHRRLLDVLVPMSVVALLFQLPALWFVGATDSPWMLAVPSGPPTMLVRGAFVPLVPWQWAYGLGGTLLVNATLAVWALRRFDTHVTRSGG